MQVQGPTSSSCFQAKDLKSSQKFDAMSFAKRMSNFDQKCSCCPYGYHIDLDFLRYLDSLYSSDTLKKLKKTRYNRDATVPRTAKPPQEVSLSSPTRTSTIAESLVTSASSGSRGKEVVVELDLSSSSRKQVTIQSSRELTAITISPKPDSKFRTETELFISNAAADDAKEQRESSTHSIERHFDLSRSIRTESYPKQTLEVSHPQRPGHLTLAQADDSVSATSYRPFSRCSSSSPVDSEASSISPAVLQAIREQMALSLHRMKELEEQVKVIPALEARISTLVRDNQLLTEVIESSSVSLGRGVGPLMGLRLIDASAQTEESSVHHPSPSLCIHDTTERVEVDVNFNRVPEEGFETPIEVSSALRTKPLDRKYYSVAIQCGLLTDDAKSLSGSGFKEEMTSVAVDVRPSVISRCVGTDGLLWLPAEDGESDISAHEPSFAWWKKLCLDKSTSVDETLTNGSEFPSNAVHTRDIDVGLTGERQYTARSAPCVEPDKIQLGDSLTSPSETKSLGIASIVEGNGVFNRGLGNDSGEDSLGEDSFELNDEYEAAVAETDTSSLQSDGHCGLSTIDAEAADFADEEVLVEKAVIGGDDMPLERRIACANESELCLKTERILATAEEVWLVQESTSRGEGTSFSEHSSEVIGAEKVSAEESVVVEEVRSTASAESKRGTMSLETNLEIVPEQEPGTDEEQESESYVALSSENEVPKLDDQRSSALAGNLINFDVDYGAINAQVIAVSDENTNFNREVENKDEEISGEGSDAENKDEVSSKGKEAENKDEKITGECKEVENKDEEISGKGKNTENKDKEITGEGKDTENKDEDISDDGKEAETKDEEISCKAENDDISGSGEEAENKDEDIVDASEDAENKDVKGEKECEDTKNKGADNVSKDEEIEALDKMSMDKETTYEEAVQTQKLQDKETFSAFADSEKGCGEDIFETDSDTIKTDEETDWVRRPDMRFSMETDEETVVTIATRQEAASTNEIVTIATRQEATSTNETSVTSRNHVTLLVATGEETIVVETDLLKACEQNLNSDNAKAICEAAVATEMRMTEGTKLEDGQERSEADDIQAVKTLEVDGTELGKNLNIESLRASEKNLKSVEIETSEDVQSLRGKQEASFQADLGDNSALCSSVAGEEQVVGVPEENQESEIMEFFEKETEGWEVVEMVSEAKKLETKEMIVCKSENREPDVRESLEDEPEIREIVREESEIRESHEFHKEPEIMESFEKKIEEWELIENESYDQKDSVEKESEKPKSNENQSNEAIEFPRDAGISLPPLAPSIDHIEIICIPDGCRDQHHESIIVSQRELRQLAIKEHEPSSSGESLHQPSGESVSGSFESGDEAVEVLQRFVEMKDSAELREKVEQKSGVELTTDSEEPAEQISKEIEQSTEPDENVVPNASMEPDKKMVSNTSLETDENVAPDTSMEPDEQATPNQVTEPMETELGTLADTAETEAGDSSNDNREREFRSSEFASTATKRVVITETRIERQRTDRQGSRVIGLNKLQEGGSPEGSTEDESVATEHRGGDTVTNDSQRPSSESQSAVDSEKTVDSFDVRPDILSACAVYAEYLRDPTLAVDSDNVALHVDFLCEHWFELAGRKTSDASLVELHLAEYQTFGTSLARTIVNMADGDGNTAMHYAVSYGNMEVILVLLDTGFCNVDKQNKAGYTAIMLASLLLVDLDQHETLVLRLFHSGDVNATSATSGQTSLMLAASHGRSAMVALLLESGAEVNLQDEDGSTALMCASEHGHASVIQALLNHPDCDSSLTDIDGSTALSIAMEEGHHDIGVYLYAHMKAIDDQLLEED